MVTNARSRHLGGYTMWVFSYSNRTSIFAQYMARLVVQMWCHKKCVMMRLDNMLKYNHNIRFNNERKWDNLYDDSNKTNTTLPFDSLWLSHLYSTSDFQNDNLCGLQLICIWCIRIVESILTKLKWNRKDSVKEAHVGLEI